MSLDAIVWLVVGIGAGIGACLMLLMIYASLERWRLGRRLLRARVLRDVPTPRPAVPPPAPAGSKLALLDQRKEGRDSAAKKAPTGEEPRAEVEPVVAKEQEPKQEPQRRSPPALALVREPEKPQAVEVAPLVVDVEPDVADAQAEPAPSPDTEPTVTPTPSSSPRAPQSVEDMFAEAFALDKVSVVPLKDEKDGAG